jgi:hypothetical protein|tara:strand:+ start:569 stop:853 length:285 start_codon:yes stop_codon:yes gene_type:complete
MGGELGDFTIDQLGGTLALVLGSVGGLCLILFKSRCETISICWGLWSCSRKVQEEDKNDEEKVSVVKPVDKVSVVKPPVPVLMPPVDLPPQVSV